ncbi:hypothetical protein K3N28_05425 [Glycomyces sp. TRM65418]|uniref:hypothetical protein n=1 Tax=Glycomyces sp. TRM65418 TaxID=2867006 RepID=UPI001CE6A13D|nr:hypothetical protein [Glycomyces sp. TRM65418]MCC3762508.1 hypothetical protein [Glycomyces sp. TRM65418]QZD56551.1 hypothetical protein K3N28_05385 [Glycomyces sp. TRM65418]
MLDLALRFRRSTKRTRAAATAAAVLVAAAVAAALLGAYGPALAAVVLLLAGLGLALVQENARLRQKLDDQHRDAMRYAAKADKRLRALDASVGMLNRKLEVQSRGLSGDFDAASRRILGAIESERFAAAERHHEIAAFLGARDGQAQQR